MTRTNQGTFIEWMDKVDTILETKHYLASLDLPDQPYRDWYDDGISPSRAARMAYAESGGE